MLSFKKFYIFNKLKSLYISLNYIIEIEINNNNLNCKINDLIDFEKIIYF